MRWMFALQRPAFVMRHFQQLQRFADAHPKQFIILATFCFAFPSILCAFFLVDVAKGVSTLVLNCAVMFLLIVFLSGPRYNLDKVAVKLVATSFRFGTCAVLLLQIIALDARKAYLSMTETRENLYGVHASQVAASALFSLIFCITLFFDCCPHFPATTQFLVTVSARHVVAPAGFGITLPAGRVVHLFWNGRAERNAAPFNRR